MCCKGFTWHQISVSLGLAPLQCLSAQHARPIPPSSTQCTNRHTIFAWNNVYAPQLWRDFRAENNHPTQRKCHAFVDPYVEHDSLILLLDLILLKRGVYRHLLYNRGSKPRRATSKSQDTTLEPDSTYLSRARWMWTLKLGTGLVAIDACMVFILPNQSIKLNHPQSSGGHICVR